MAGISITRQIEAPVEAVFAQATDFANAPSFIEGIKKLEILTDGPVGNGTRFRETRVMFGREAVEEMEVRDFEPPHRYTLCCENHGCRYRSELQMRPNGSGTEIRMTFEATPVTTFAKLMSVLMRPMMKSVAKECAKDLDNIKTAVETAA